MHRSLLPLRFHGGALRPLHRAERHARGRRRRRRHRKPRDGLVHCGGAGGLRRDDLNRRLPEASAVPLREDRPARQLRRA